jgi:hypothetical protein
MSGARQSGVATPSRLAALAASTLAALAACSASPPTTLSPSRSPPKALPAPAAVPEPGDASDDWRGLLIVPFGSPLKDVPLTLHEVLLFRDQGRAVGTDLPEDAECYATDTAAPRFAGQVPYEYLLCFKQDRLTRIQAAVHLPPTEAPGVFAAVCARWLKTSVPGGASAAAAGTAVPTDTQGDDCEGRDGAVRFSGRLGDQSEAQATLSITLDGIADP